MRDLSVCQKNDIIAKAQQAQSITDFYNELRVVNKKIRAPTFIQTPLKEQWAESKTAESLSLQPACYVILEFGKYYVSEQLRIPRSCIFIRPFFFHEKLVQRNRPFSLSLLFMAPVCAIRSGRFSWYCRGYAIFPWILRVSPLLPAWLLFQCM